MIYYFIGINLCSFILMYIDKSKAINNEYRISEKQLFIISFIGGFIGIYIGMNLFRHKTKKISFKIVILLSLLIWAYLLFLLKV